MRYFPGIVLCLMAVAIFAYNTQAAVPFNIPFLREVGVDSITERGERTWQLLLGAGVMLLVIAGALQLIQPKPEPLIHDESDQKPW